MTARTLAATAAVTLGRREQADLRPFLETVTRVDVSTLSLILIGVALRTRLYGASGYRSTFALCAAALCASALVAGMGRRAGRRQRIALPRGPERRQRRGATPAR
jgi:hypothetical protein